MLRTSGKGNGLSGNDKLHSPRVSGAAWRLPKMKGGKDRGGNLPHGRDLGRSPELRPSSAQGKKHEQRVVKGTVSTPNPCSGAPLGSLAPTHHPAPLLQCAPTACGTHTPTPPPCSAAPHDPWHCGPMAAVPPPVRRRLLRAGQGQLRDKADPPQPSSPAAQQHVPRMALLPPAGAMAPGTAEEVSRGVRP